MRRHVATVFPVSLVAFLGMVGLANGQDSQTPLSPETRSLGDFSSQDQSVAPRFKIGPGPASQNWNPVPDWEMAGPWDVDLGIPGEGQNADNLIDAEALSIISVNAYRRWSDSSSGLSPYLGAGVGISMARVPNSDIDRDDMGLGHILPGAAMQFVAGASVDLGNNVSVFGQVQGSYALSLNDSGMGSRFEAIRLNNGINIGVSLGF